MGAMFLTLLDLQTVIGIYVNMQKNKRHTISHIFKTDFQKSFRSSTCTRQKTHIPLDLFAKDTACTREQIHLGLLLDLSAKDTAVELMYKHACAGTFITDC